jgi:tetraacyldisaccharide 4'-kinase
MRPPRLWQSHGPLALALSPLGWFTAQATARRVARPGWHAPVPVICCGNASVGGSGKTPLCLDILARLRRQGVDAHALTRGYGGGLRGPARVDPLVHTAADVGDEALLLAAVAPVWIGADRAASARLAIAAGAQALVMDDGLQNPSLVKTLSLLVVDGGAGFGNGYLIPAGPLREPVSKAASRCAAVVLIGHDTSGAAAALPPALPVLQADLEPGPDMLALAGQRVIAFAGIGRPEKFFATLEQAGIAAVQQVAFPDHHAFTAADFASLHAAARKDHAVLVTTAKDFVRIGAAARAGITALPVSLRWRDETAIDRLLAAAAGHERS